jgi:hypothetical protein
MTGRAPNSFGSSFDETKAGTFRSTPDVVRRWLTIGTGIGIEIAPPNLRIVVVRVRPQGATVVGQLVIPNFDERLPSEWKAEYKAFLRQLGVALVGAVILLPREEVISRTIHLPGVVNKLIPAALEFELDSLNPWANEEPVHDWASIGRSSSILVAMTKRWMVQRYMKLFEQADIKVSHFTCDAAALYASVHMFGHSQPGNFLAIGEYQGKRVVYGESHSLPLFSVRLETSLERARSTGIALLRLDPDLEAISISEALPKPLVTPPAFDPDTWSMTYVAALCAANPWFVRTINLLPREHRQSNMRTVYMPTFVLGSLLALAVGVLAWLSSTAQKHYRRAILAEIDIIEPQVRKSEDLDRRIAVLRSRALTIDEFRMRTKDDMDALSELTQLITPPTWVRSMLLTRHSLALVGEAEQAASLLKVIDSSTQFSGSEFSAPVVRAGRLEGFSIRAKRKVMNHEAY